MQGLEKCRQRPNWISWGIGAVIVAAGLGVRLAPLGLPAVVVKYGGSTLWALMIYWVLSSLMQKWPLVLIASMSGTVATAVEIFKLYRSPGMDAFRLTPLGMLLLGRIFSGWDIVAYWIAIAAGVVLDAAIRQSRSRT
jgi:hypothetical protein